MTLNVTSDNCTTEVTGRVLSSAGYPLQGVVITPSNAPHDSLSITSVSGEFAINMTINTTNGFINGSRIPENLTLYHTDHLMLNIGGQDISTMQPLAMQKRGLCVCNIMYSSFHGNVASKPILSHKIFIFVYYLRQRVIKFMTFCLSVG